MIIPFLIKSICTTNSSHFKLIQWIRSEEVFSPSKVKRLSHIVWKLLTMSHLNFWILAFCTIFCPIKTDLSGNTVWPQASGFQKLAKMEHFWHFWLTQNVNVAGFARNVAWDFFCDFQTPCSIDFLVPLSETEVPAPPDIFPPTPDFF